MSECHKLDRPPHRHKSFFERVAAGCVGGVAYCLLVTAVSAGQPHTGHRYVSPSGAFSISLDDYVNSGFHAGAESNSGNTVLADFPHRPTMGLALVMQRSVEWVRIGKPVDRLAFDAQATALVNEYLEARFGSGKLVIKSQGKLRSDDGKLFYAFAAKGTYGQYIAVWQGVIRFFDNGVALVSEVVAQPTQSRFVPTDGIIDQQVVDWAMTLEPGS